MNFIETWTTNHLSNWSARQNYGSNYYGYYSTTSDFFPYTIASLEIDIHGIMDTYTYGAWDNTGIGIVETVGMYSSVDGFGISYQHRTNQVPDTDNMYVRAYSREAASMSYGGWVAIPNAYKGDSDILDFHLEHSGTTVTLEVSCGTVSFGTSTVTTNVFDLSDLTSSSKFAWSGLDSSGLGFAYEAGPDDTVRVTNDAFNGGMDFDVLEWRIFGNPLFNDTLSIPTDSFTLNVDKPISDTFSIPDSLTLNVDKPISDTFSIPTDSFTLNAGKPFADTFTESDNVEIYHKKGFGLIGETYNVTLSYPKAIKKKLSKNIETYDFWDGTFDTVDAGLNDRDLSISGYEYQTTPSIAVLFNQINEMMNNGEELTLVGIEDCSLDECFSGVYIIKDFSYNTVKGCPSIMEYKLTLKYVREE